MFERFRGERMPIKEQLSLGKGEYVGFQGRLLLGQAFLDPNTEFKKHVAWQDLNITPETYKPIERLSELERKQYWKDQAPDKNAQEQKQIWAQNVVSVIEGKKDYFESEEGKKRKELYGKLGINLDGFNQHKAIAMYDHFFAKDRKGHEVEKFAEEVLNLDIYNDPTDDNFINFAKVKEDLGAIAWLGSIFGAGSALIMTELIAAEARIYDKKEEQVLVKELNKKDKWLGRGQRRINKLNEVEKGVFEYMNVAAKTNELKVPEALKEYIKIPVINIPSDMLPVAPVGDDENDSGLLGSVSAVARRVGSSIVGVDKKLQDTGKRYRRMLRHKRPQPVGYDDWRD